MGPAVAAGDRLSTGDVCDLLLVPLPHGASDVGAHVSHRLLGGLLWSKLIRADHRACDLDCRTAPESVALRAHSHAAGSWFEDERGVGSAVRAGVDLVGEGLDMGRRSGTRVNKPPGV